MRLGPVELRYVRSLKSGQDPMARAGTVFEYMGLAMRAQTRLLGGPPTPARRRRAVASRCLAAAFIGIMLCLVASAAAAQRPDRQEPWWRSPAVRSQIALTSQQAERIETIYHASLPERRRLRQQATTLQKQLDQLLATGTMADGQAVPLIGRLCAVDVRPLSRLSGRATSPALAFFRP